MLPGKESFKTPRILFDYNGDMIPDIMKIGLDNTVIDKGLAFEDWVIGSIKDGFNNEIKIKYDFYRIADYGQSFTYPYSTISYIRCAENITKYSNNTLIANNEFNFSWPVSHLQGKGFIGFSRIQTNDLFNNTSNLKEFILNTTAVTLELRNEILTDKYERKYINTMHLFNVVQPISNKKYFTYHKTEETVNDLIFQTKTKNIWEIDANGNTTKVISEVRPYNLTNTSNKFIRTTQNNTYKNCGNNVFKPLSETKTITNELNETKTVRQYYEYNFQNKLRKALTDYGNDTLNIAMIYENYNSYGQPTKVKDLTLRKTRSTEYTYDSKGRWIIAQKDPLGNIIQRTYEPLYGNCIEEITSGNLVTTNSYDSWGRLIRTLMPDGEEITLSYGWNNSVLPNSLYYKETQSSRNGLIRTYFDALGREVMTKTNVNSLNGETSVETRYNDKGLVAKKSLPYTQGTTENEKQWTEYHYDHRNRLTREYGNLIEREYEYTDGVFSSKVAVTDYSNITTSSEEYNHLGQLIKKTDALGSTLTYEYTVDGKTKKIVSPSGETTITYDLAGNRRSITEPNSGTKSAWYNGYGDVIKSVDSKDIISENEYDDYGRQISHIQSLYGNSNRTDYSYYPIDNNISYSGALESVSNGASTTTYAYDEFMRLVSKKEEIDGIIFEKNYSYDENSRISQVTYPSYYNENRLVLDYSYTSRGKLQEISKDGITLWYYVSDNEYGQPHRVVYGNGTGTIFSYNIQHQLINIQTGVLFTTIWHRDKYDSYKYDGIHFNIQDLRYTYNDKYLIGRRDNFRGQVENFVYDDLERLKSFSVNGVVTEMNYQGNGNIEYKSDIGGYAYTIFPPNGAGVVSNYQMIGVVTPPLPIDERSIETEYTLFNKIERISQGEKEMLFYYNPDKQRIKSDYKEGGELKRTIYYIGDYECEISSTGDVRELSYVNTPFGASIINLRINNTIESDSLYFIYKDNLGSYDRVYNQNIELIEAYGFDAWGNRRNHNNWNETDTSTNHLFRRGFTGHEHLDEFGLINMNGRLYDPAIAQFLSPDPYVADATNTQDYNRYTYARNNPLMYTDPSGEWIHLVIGAVIGGVVNLIANANNVHNFWQGLGYFGIGAVAGALSAGIGVGIGAAMAGGSFGAGFLGAATSQAANAVGFIAGSTMGAGAGAAGGILTGLGNGLLGGKDFGGALKQGLINGGIGALTGGIVGGISGGITARLQGKNFWNGSKTINNVLVEQNISQVTQDGAMNCGPASVEAVDKSLGGDLTQQQIREMITPGSNPNTDPLQVSKIWDNYGAANPAREIKALIGETQNQIIKSMQDGYRAVVNLKLDGNIGHSVVLKSIVERTIIKISGASTTNTIYNVMDPAGSFLSIHFNKILTSSGTVLIR